MKFNKFFEMKRYLFLIVLAMGQTAFGQLKVANIFGDHMVLQRDKPIKVWGWNTAGEKVTINFHEKNYSVLTSSAGRWEIELSPEKTSKEGWLMQVSDSDEKLEFSDILIGEVWLCSGQSNMEWKVNAVNNAETEIATANYPLIRHIEIPKATAFEPQKDFEDKEWQVCSPETVGGFTAVGYFFARKISAELGIPVGLVHSSWGGSHVETWISRESMLTSDVLRDYALTMPQNWKESDRKMEKATIKKFHGTKDFDISSLNEEEYLSDSYDFSDWIKISPMYQWDWKGVPSFRGTVYIQKDIKLDSDNHLAESSLNFGYTSGDIAFYINGKLVHHGYHKDKIVIDIPKGIWKKGINSLLVKFSANREPKYTGLGLYGSSDDYSLEISGKSIPLMKEEWYARPSWESERTYAPWMNNEGALLYNGMIAPIVGFEIKGALWYQGESNAGRAHDYRKSFPLLIKDWRKQWSSEFPFYWVQLSSYGPFNDSNSSSAWAELREAQSMTLALPKTGEAVIIDIGNPKDIHPRNKQDVGLRLGLNVLENTYGFNILGSGPRYKSMRVKGNKAELSFSYVGEGLKSSNKYGNLEGFEIAGADQKFYFAKAEIINDKVVVSHEAVKRPVAVRYGWSDSPIDANLYNSENLPASPFRTDAWKGVTEGVHFE